MTDDIVESPKESTKSKELLAQVSEFSEVKRCKIREIQVLNGEIYHLI